MFNQIDEIESLIIENNIKLLSVDVFDTVLLRSSCPELKRFQRFCQLQWRHFLFHTSISEAEFFFLRLKVGKELYQKAKTYPGQYEVTYEELYGVIGLELSEHIEESLGDFIDGCLRIELDAELSDLRINSRLWSFLNQQKERGRDVIFCSDMYLSSGSIRYLIESLANDSLFGKLYVSSDWQKTKRDKTLFEAVIESYSIKPDNVLHIGDHRSSDFDVPLSMGMSAFLFRRPLPWTYLSKIKKEIYLKYLNFNGLISK